MNLMHGNHPATDADNTAWTKWCRATVLICALAGAIDSFDTQMIGFTGRQIASDLAFPVSRLGWIFGASQLGGVIGAILFGWLADRFGRSRMLIVACIVAACATAASLKASGFPAFLILRAITGLGLGGVMPCFLSLGVEAIPARLRVVLTPVLYACFPVGGVVGAWISAPVITAYGWRGVFVMGAGSLVVIAGLILVLPLVEHDTANEKQTAIRASALLSRDFVRVTWWLWGLFFLAPSGVYLLVLWMPTLIQLMGVSAARAGMLVGFLNIGGLVGAVVGGWALTRFRRLTVLGSFLLVGTSGFPLIAAVHADWSALVGVSILTGSAIAGTMSLLVSIAANAYPTELRATGIGWAMGVARIGQMTAPIPIGLLLQHDVSPWLVLAFCGLPTLVALVPLYGVDRALNARRTHLAA